MISNEAEHPNCMYMWMDHIISPEANAKVSAWFGEAPSQSKACAEFKNLDPAYFAAPNHCKLYNADNPEFWSRVYYWETPLAIAATIVATCAWTTTTGSRPGPRSRGRR